MKTITIQRDETVIIKIKAGKVTIFEKAMGVKDLKHELPNDAPHKHTLTFENDKFLSK